MSNNTGTATATGAVVQLDTSKTYLLQNARSGTVLDMSNDYKTIHGYTKGNSSNQQWEFIPSAGQGYAICCVRRSKAEGYPMYLTVEEGAFDGALIVASPYPVNWKVETTDDAVRISWPNSELSITLGDEGSSKNGTQIQLAPLESDEPTQLWNYTATQRTRFDDQE